MKMLQKLDGSVITNHANIAQEVIEYYSSLMGHNSPHLNHIDIKALREGKQFSLE